MRRLGTSSRANYRSRPKAKPKENTPFLCDLILLPGPSVNTVPRQGKRVALTETTIMEAFGETIPRLVDIEILMSVHNKLVKPTLAPGQEGITGVILHRLFKNKPIYVRPDKVLLPDLSEDMETKDDPEFKFDDDDDSILDPNADPNSSSRVSQLPVLPQVNTDQSPGQSGRIPDVSTPVQRLPHGTETDTNSSQASQLPLQPQVNTNQSPGQSGYIPDVSTPVQRLPLGSETDTNSSQASQLPLQPQVNPDQSPGQSGRIPEADAPFDLPSELDAVTKHVFLH